MTMEMNHYQADVLCVSETRLNGMSEETIPVCDSNNSYLFLDCGVQDGSGDHAVSFMIRPPCAKNSFCMGSSEPENGQTTT